MILYCGKARNYNFKTLLYRIFFELARPLEQLEEADFGKN